MDWIIGAVCGVWLTLSLRWVWRQVRGPQSSLSSTEGEALLVGLRRSQADLQELVRFERGATEQLLVHFEKERLAHGLQRLELEHERLALEHERLAHFALERQGAPLPAPVELTPVSVRPLPPEGDDDEPRATTAMPPLPEEDPTCLWDKSQLPPFAPALGPTSAPALLAAGLAGPKSSHPTLPSMPAMGAAATPYKRFAAPLPRSEA